MLTAIGILLSIGICQPATKLETIADAKAAQAEIRGEFKGKIEELRAQRTEDVQRNDKEHERIFGELKEQRDKIFTVLDRLDRRFQAADNAPAGQKFQRGKPVP